MRKAPWWYRWLFNIYPPYLGAGVKIDFISADFRYVKVSMKLTWYNRNYVGTQFGGSLYSMVDPFYMLMIMRNLGRDYVVWDKSATINFISPGTGKVHCECKIDEALLAEIRHHTANGEKYLPSFQLKILDSQGKTVATVDKVVYIRRKQRQ
ncbi:DUF4442 domain-containing protein [Pseudomonas sp. F1_0610]|uniref:DUF4442 domain-containing protein n=1 Tax=Pseudomonas sp. F1_0610 TaxID=3114284 RepID=UPI0039C26780